MMPPITHETINTIVAVLSLIVAIVLPFVVYYKLDPKIQELRNAPKLEVIESETQDRGLREVAVTVRNKGILPATNLRVVFRSNNDGFDWPAEPEIRLFPPSPHEVRCGGRDLVVQLDRNLGKDQELTVAILGLKTPEDAGAHIASAWVYHEYGAAPPTYIQDIYVSRNLENGTATSSMRVARAPAEHGFIPGSTISDSIKYT